MVALRWKGREADRQGSIATERTRHMKGFRHGGRRTDAQRNREVQRESED